MGKASVRAGGGQVAKAAILLTVLALSGCSTLGLACGPEPADGPTAKQVAWDRCRASGGDKTAQYEMGRRYWQGDGVPHDREKAVSWLEKSAAPIEKSRSYVYVPPVGSQKFGTVQGFDMPGEGGNMKAQALLDDIRHIPHYWAEPEWLLDE